MKNITVLSGFAAILFTLVCVAAAFTIKDPMLGKVLLLVNAFFLGVGVFTAATTITEHNEENNNEIRGIWNRFDEVDRNLAEMNRDFDEKISQIYRDQDSIYRRIDDAVESHRNSTCKHK